MKLFSLLIFLVITISAISQTTYNPEIFLGVRTGINTSYVFFQPSVSQSIFPGSNFGLSFIHFQEKNLGIELDIQYSRVGWKEQSDDGYNIHRINTLQLPFLSHFTFVNNDGFLLNFGPYISYVINEKETITTNQVVAETQFLSVDNKIGYGLIVGLGASWKTRIGLLQFEFRNSLAFTDLLDPDVSRTFSLSKAYIAELSLIYGISISPK